MKYVYANANSPYDIAGCLEGVNEHESTNTQVFACLCRVDTQDGLLCGNYLNCLFHRKGTKKT